MAVVASSLPSLLSGEAFGFCQLDDRLASGVPGQVVVRAAPSLHAPLRAHLGRRLRTSGFTPLLCLPRPGASLFHEVTARLGIDVGHTDPATLAESIAEAANRQRSALVVSLPAVGTWDHAVATALREFPRLFFVLLVPDDALATAGSTPFEVPSTLDAAAKLRWFGAVAEEAERDLAADALPELEAWWTDARRAEPRDADAVLASLESPGRQAARVLALAGRSLGLGTLETICQQPLAAHLDDLVRREIAVAEGGRFGLAPHVSIPELPTADERIAVAEALQHEHDPWALARAAELFLAAGDFERADHASELASQRVDPLVANELQTRWFAAVQPVGGGEGVDLRRRAAQRALGAGEAIEAQRWCESAAALDPGDPVTHLLLARAHTQLGDLVAARVCLGRAEANAAGAADPTDLRARIATERGEIAYLAGDLDGARAHATAALELTTPSSTRLAARSVLGKLLLARGAFDAADEHFAEDALQAATALDTTAELRARLNRGIALLSKGQLDVARGVLERVLTDATELKEERARAFSLSNLGLVAYRQRDYGAALDYWERTIAFPQALRGRLPTALTIGNLADLRLRLGLVDHADHALAFGRRLFHGSTPPRCGALFKWIAAQIALARGNTSLARREIDAALIDAQASGDRTYLESASVVAVRVALEDGNLARAGELLEQAATIAQSPRARAEVAIVRAATLRATGKPALESATEALEVAREAGEEDLLFEIHALLAVLHRDAGEPRPAQAHATQAAIVRDQIADTLTNHTIRAAFLAKPDVVAAGRVLAALQAIYAPHEVAPAPQSSRAPASRSIPERLLVGDDPQIRSLAIAIAKVGRSPSTVLVRGESGTGKELVASALHRASDRAAGPLVSVNCAALVETLLLSELFGHEKGAFTGASSRRRGRFELAEGGTLFLDEIGDISARTQVALLRVLQERTFERVGGTTPIRANVRVVCATHRDLRAMVERGEFREDLYYRLRQITLDIPPLRARLGDLPRIAEHLLRRIATERNEPAKELAADAIELLVRHRWPGNVRELENVLRAVTIFTEGDVIRAADVVANVDDLRFVANAAPISVRPSVSLALPLAPSPIAVEGDDEDGPDSASIPPVLPTDEASATAVAYSQVRQGAVSLSDLKRQIERDCIARALAETRGNITRAAALLGMKRPRLSQLVKQYGLSGAASPEGNS